MRISKSAPDLLKKAVTSVKSKTDALIHHTKLEAHFKFLSVVYHLDKHHQNLSISNMRISKSALELLKKAVTSVKSKTDALRTKLIILASVRRRLAVVRAISRQIHGVTPSNRQEKQARVEHRNKVLTVRKAMTRPTKEPASDQGVRAHPGLFEVAMFEEDYHGCYPDWTNSLFEDDHCYKNEDVDGDDHDDLDIVDALNEPSVIEIIRSKREVEGLEFNMDDDIDEACDMFIRRFRSRMNRSFSDFCISE